MWRWHRNTPPPIALALQGGGAHGAYTWGVLDALLERGVDVAAMSGASAGALNAIVLAHGLLDGGNDGARAALERFWDAVGSHLPAGWFHAGDPPRLTSAARAVMHWTRLLSPYQLNPLGLDPLRDIVRVQVDFERLRATRGPALHVATTHANSGRLRLFGRHDLTLDAALASACLPTLHPAVQIDGEPYWDGGYAANPALFPLAYPAGAPADLMIVTLSPHRHGAAPVSAREIQERAVEIAFNATFLREVRTLAELQALARASAWRAGALERRLARLRFHHVDGDAALAALPAETRLVAHRPFLHTLRDLGRAHAEAWWRLHAGSLGRASSADLLALYGAP